MNSVSLARALFLFLICVTAFAAPEKPSEVRILVDISGSMKQSDPNNLRISAVNLLVELLPDGSRAGIWTFGRQINRLVPPAQVDAKWRAEAKAKARLINSVGLYTNLVGVLEDANRQLPSEFSHHIILLTDGRIDMREPGDSADTDNQEKQRLLHEILPQYVKNGTKIHTLALSDYVDHELMQQISAATGGLYLQANTADDLAKVFMKALARSVPIEQVPLAGNSFKIDGAVKEFTALIFRKSNAPKTQLISPSGKVLNEKKRADNVNWYQDIGFDLITVSQPEVGEWLVEADLDPDNRIQVLTDLKLQASGIAANLFLGAPIKLETMLTNQGKVVLTPEILRTTAFKLTVTAPDGRVGSKVLSDPEQIPLSGIYREDLSKLSTEGEYRFEISATGRTFSRQQVLNARLFAPLKVQQQKLPTDETFLVVVKPEASVDTHLSRINASIIAPNGVSSITHLHFDEDSKLWELRVKAEQGPGEYQVILSIHGVLLGGVDFNYQPEMSKVTFPLALEKAAKVSSTATSIAGVQEASVPVASPTNAAGIELPSLAEAYRQQQELTAKEESAPSAESTDAVVEDDNAEQDGSIWLYVAIAASLLAGIGGGAYWWLREKRPTVAASEEATVTPANEPPARTVPEDLIQQDIVEATEDTEESTAQRDLEKELAESLDNMAGDFDAFEGEQEIEIPIPSLDDNPATPETLTALDDEFALDPDKPTKSAS